METYLGLLGFVLVSLYMTLWVIGPMVLTDWFRKRREESVKRQIALTEAIHGQVGPIVSPEVTKPFWGPWQIRMAVPFTQPTEVGRILSVVNGLLSATNQLDQYQIVLTPRETYPSDNTPWNEKSSVKRWSRGTAVA